MESPSKRILLYSPDVVGHPRVYCRVIADALTSQDCDLIVAMGFTDEVGLEHSPDLHPLAARERVHLIDTRAYSKNGQPHLCAEELIALQSAFSVDITLFIEAEKSNSEFARIAAGEAPRLIGRNLGIFANAAEWYPGEDPFTGEQRTILAPTLRTTLGNIKRMLFQRHRSAAHFYERTILASGVLDEILVKDERIADWHGPPVYWMPEISRPPPCPETAAEAIDYVRSRGELDAFLASNVGKEPVLFFGEAAYYKGYDLFLQFIAATPSACAIHSGVSYDRKQVSLFRGDVEGLRAKLRSEGRLFETNAYVHTQRLKELYFGSVRVYVTTHRLALSSSTVIQALEMGKPVLVPDRGLLGYRVRQGKIGDVYRYEDMADLQRKAFKLWSSDLSAFAQPTSQFWKKFSDESIRAFFIARLGATASREPVDFGQEASMTGIQAHADRPDTIAQSEK